MSPGRIVRLAALLMVGGAGGLGAWVGWGAPVRRWPQATGWERIPRAERPPARELWRDPGAPPPRLWWLGHAGFLVEWHGTRLLLDPNTSARCTIAPRLLEAALDPALLGPIDAAVVSHSHFDHLDLATLRLARLGAIVLPRGSERHLGHGWDGVRQLPLVAGESVRIGGLEVVAVAAAHHGGRLHPLRSRQAALGYVLRRSGDAAGPCLYVAGDTCAGLDFAALRRRYRPRAAILPIGAYAPRWLLAPYHLTPEEAVEAAGVLGVETVVPAHFGTFVLALDRPAAALPRFARAAWAAGLAWVMPELLRSPRQLAPARKEERR